MNEPKSRLVETTLPGTERFAANDPCGEDCPAYRYLFQAWVVLFLMVLCFALLSYLVTFIT